MMSSLAFDITRCNLPAIPAITPLAVPCDILPPPDVTSIPFDFQLEIPPPFDIGCFLPEISSSLTVSRGLEPSMSFSVSSKNNDNCQQIFDLDLKLPWPECYDFSISSNQLTLGGVDYSTDMVFTVTKTDGVDRECNHVEFGLVIALPAFPCYDFFVSSSMYIGTSDISDQLTFTVNKTSVSGECDRVDLELVINIPEPPHLSITGLDISSSAITVVNVTDIHFIGPVVVGGATPNATVTVPDMVIDVQLIDYVNGVKLQKKMASDPAHWVDAGWKSFGTTAIDTTITCNPDGTISTSDPVTVLTP